MNATDVPSVLWKAMTAGNGVSAVRWNSTGPEVWFPTCAGRSLLCKTMFGLVWGGENEQTLMKEHFVEVMPCTCLFQIIGMSLEFLENTMQNSQGKTCLYVPTCLKNL